MMDVEIDLDQDSLTCWMIEVQYTGGRLLRKAHLDENDAIKHWEFVTQRASTDWARLSEVKVTTKWRQTAEWTKER
jgi:hypothetical protein